LTEIRRVDIDVLRHAVRRSRAADVHRTARSDTGRRSVARSDLAARHSTRARTCRTRSSGSSSASAC
jgi:hypothetical protein